MWFDPSIKNVLSIFFYSFIPEKQLKKPVDAKLQAIEALYISHVIQGGGPCPDYEDMTNKQLLQEIDSALRYLPYKRPLAEKNQKDLLIARDLLKVS